MKHQIAQILHRNIVSDATVATLVQSLCIVMGVVLLFLPVWTLSALDLTKAQMIFGVLLSLNTAMLFIGFGVLLPMVIARKTS